MMQLDAKIYVAGHTGLAGSALVRQLHKQGYENLLLRTHAELDLMDAVAVHDFFDREQPDYVFLAAAKVGGICANNTYPADFIYKNLAIQTNVIHESWCHNVRRLLFLGSSCIYPRDCPQPIKEEYLLTGPLEPTNRPYALAKIAGIEMCWAYNRQYGTQYIAAMPTNLYGPNDNYDLENSHVLPALIRKMHEAKEKADKTVVIWGSGAPRREFLHSDDLAAASIFLMNLSDSQMEIFLSQQELPLINIGYGADLTIRELAKMIAEIVGFQGDLIFDREKLDGAPRKLLDTARMHTFGWKPTYTLKVGIVAAYQDFLEACTYVA